LPIPVARAAHFLELVGDRGLVLVLKRLDLRDELLARKISAALFSSFCTRFSTTAWVAIPAWSVPGIQSVS